LFSSGSADYLTNRPNVNKKYPLFRSVQHDPNRPEDVLKVDADEEGVGGDDAADALRYLVATKTREIRARKLRGV